MNINSFNRYQIIYNFFRLSSIYLNQLCSNKARHKNCKPAFTL